MSEEVGKKNLNIVRNIMNSTLACMALQHVQKACDTIMKLCLLGPLQAVLQQYLWLNIVVILLQVISQRPDGLVPLKEEKRFLKRCHLGRDLRESTPPQESRQLKLIKRSDICRI